MTTEEAIERIKSRYDKWALDDKDLEAIQYIFPKLSESEDERIRTRLIALVEAFGQGTYKDEMLAYLEKQKEQKLAERAIMQNFNYHDGEPDEKAWSRLIAILNYAEATSNDTPGEEVQALINWVEEKKIDKKPAEWSEEDEYMRYKATAILNKLCASNEEFVWAHSTLVNVFNWLKFLPKRFNLQPKVEWNKEYREEDLRTRFAFYTYKNEEDDGILYLSNVFVEETSRNKGFGTKILTAAEKVAETIGAITIRLKVKQNSPANSWYRKHGYGYLTFEDGYDWLEKNLEYLKPKQEWSEEDKTALGDLMWCIEQARKSAKDENDMGNIWFAERWLHNRLESLRPRSHWEPSEEQMEALFTCTSVGSFGHREALKSLYNDLKKL